MIALILSGSLAIGNFYHTDISPVILPDIKPVIIDHNVIPWCLFDRKYCLQ